MGLWFFLMEKYPFNIPNLYPRYGLGLKYKVSRFRNRKLATRTRKKCFKNMTTEILLI